MSNFGTRIALQQSRFNLIQSAAEEEIHSVSRQLVSTRLEVLEHNWAKFQEDHESLCHEEGDTLIHHEYFRARIFERCQAFYVFSRAKLLTQRDDLEAIDNNTRSLPSEPGVLTSLMPRSALPRISLPTFNGNYNSWRPFHDLFVSLIRDNSELSTIEKMHYLKTCLTGEAFRLISNLPLSADNFAIAWEILVSRYENKRLLVNAQLDRLANLKPLKTKSAQNLRSLLTNVTETIGALRALGCPVHYWDPILLHQLVRLLDPDTREAWEVQLGSTTDNPTFKQFEEFLVGRTRAIENLSLQVSTTTTHKERSLTYSSSRFPSKAMAHVASSFDQSSIECLLCKGAHQLRNCPRYQGKTPKQRHDVIVKARRCFNCLGSHTVKKCSSTKRCFKCGSKHHTSIHDAFTRSNLNNSGVTRPASSELTNIPRKQIIDNQEAGPSTL